jgi:hypothetical protein
MASSRTLNPKLVYNLTNYLLKPLPNLPTRTGFLLFGHQTRWYWIRKTLLLKC